MKQIILNKHQLQRMSQRAIDKSDIKKVLKAKIFVEAPGNKPNRKKRMARVGERNVVVVYVETKHCYHIVTVFAK